MVPAHCVRSSLLDFCDSEGAGAVGEVGGVDEALGRRKLDVSMAWCPIDVFISSECIALSDFERPEYMAGDGPRYSTAGELESP